MKQERSLLMEFENRYRKQMGAAFPQELIQSFVDGNSLKLNLCKIKAQESNFLSLLISFPFKQIHIFQDSQQSNQSLEQKNYNTNQSTRKQTNYLEIVIKRVDECLQRQNNRHLRSVKFQNIPLKLSHMQSILTGIQRAKYLKQLSFVNCSLNDSHLDIMKQALSQNVSLNIIDFSFNNLQEIGESIFYILSKHGQRKRQILALHEKNNKIPQFNISNTGIFQINLQGNQLSSKTIDQIVKFLYNDKWVKSLNLQQNQLLQQQISKFSSLMQFNQTLLNLDLRNNPGFNKKYSKIIFSKLKLNLSQLKTTNLTKKTLNIQINNQSNQSKNIQFNSPEIKSKFKLLNEQEKINLQKTNNQRAKQFPLFNKQQLTKSDLFLNRLKKNLTAKILIKSPQRFKNPSNHHSHRKIINSLNKSDQNQLSKFLKTQKQNQTLEIKNLNNTSLASQYNKNKLKGSKKPLKISPDEAIQPECQKCCQLQKKLTQTQKRCNQMHLKTLKAEKQNLQLEIELKKLKCFIEKNRDVSVIGTSANKILLQNVPQLTNQNSNVSTSFNRLLGNENDQEMISRIQVLVTELTRIMQTVQQYQNTQNTIQHPFSNVNSFSKTVSLYERRQELMQIQQQILQDEALHLQQFGNESITLIQNNENGQN